MFGKKEKAETKVEETKVEETKVEEVDFGTFKGQRILEVLSEVNRSGEVRVLLEDGTTRDIPKEIIKTK